MSHHFKLERTEIELPLLPWDVNLVEVVVTIVGTRRCYPLVNIDTKISIIQGAVLREVH